MFYRLLKIFALEKKDKPNAYPKANIKKQNFKEDSVFFQDAVRKIIMKHWFNHRVNSVISLRSKLFSLWLKMVCLVRFQAFKALHSSLKSEGFRAFKTNKKNQPYLIGFVLLAILIAYTKAAVVIPLFIGIAALSRFSQNLLPFVAGFDLCLFLTVLTAAAYGSTAGFIVGICSFFLGDILRKAGHMEYKAVFYIGMGLTGFLVPCMPFTDILYTGLVATVFYDALVVVFYFLMVRKCAVNAVLFAATHIAFNWWLFSSFGGAILSFL